MSTVAKRTKSEYSTAPEGLYSAVCIDVIDLGLVKDQFGEAEKIRIRWMLDEKDEDGKSYTPAQTYRLSLHEKSNLCKMLEAWRGRKFTVEELEGFDVQKVIGANCQIQIQHNIKDEGKVYANVVAVVPAARGAVKMAIPSDYVRECDRTHRAELQANPNGESKDEWVPF